MPQVRVFSFPRFGLPRPTRRYGHLGQTNAAANLVPGQTYTFTYSFKTGLLSDTVTEDDVASALASWSPFASGVLGFADMNVNQMSSILTVSILANDGAENLTQGNVQASIAATLNSAAGSLGGPYDTVFTATGAGTAGLQTPSNVDEYLNQLANTPTPSIVDTIKALLGTGPAIPPPSNPSAPWYVYAAGLAILGLAVYQSVQ